jgi:hypothetical protein
VTGIVPRKPRNRYRHSFFDEEALPFDDPEDFDLPPSAPPPNRRNRFARSTSSTVLVNPFGKVPPAPDNVALLFAPDGMFDKRTRKRFPFQVTLLFGFGDEMNRFGLRSVFAAARPLRTLITVPGFEDTGSGTSPLGIDAATINRLFKSRFGGKGVFVDDDDKERDPTTADWRIRVLAAFRDGSAGLLETMEKTASLGFKLDALDRLVFLDALTKNLDAKRLEAALSAALSANDELRAVCYYATAAGTARMTTVKESMKMVDGAGKEFWNRSLHLDLRPTALAQLRTLVLRRLLENGIADGFLVRANVEAVCKPLLDLALPARGTLSSHNLFRARPNRLLSEWQTDNAAALKAVTKAHREAALDLVVANVLTGHAPPAKPADPKHPFEVLDDQFVAELAWESLPAPRAARDNARNPYFTDEFLGGELLEDRPNVLKPFTSTGTASPDPLDAVERTTAASATLAETHYSLYLPTIPVVGKQLKISLLYAVGSELNRRGLRRFFRGAANTAAIVGSGIERGWAGTGGTAWAKSIDRAQVNALIKDALKQIDSFFDASKKLDLTDSFKDKWTIEILAGYSTGYHGVVATTVYSLDPPHPKGKPAPVTLDLPLTGVRRVIFYDCMYRRDSARAGVQMADALRILMAKTSARICVYRMSSGGNTDAAVAHARSLGKRVTVIDKLAAAMNFRMLYFARMLKDAVADGYFTDGVVPDGFTALVSAVPARGTIASDALVLTDTDASATRTSATTIDKFAKDHAADIASAQKQQSRAHELILWYSLAGWNPALGEMDHDGHLAELGWEYLVP